MTSKLGMQYTFLINYAQLLASGLPLALMHSVFCDLACVTCHSPLPLPNQVTAFPLTCCPFPLTRTCCRLLFWAFKLERARFEAMHVHRHSLSSSKWLRLHFEHSSWRCHLPINICAGRVWHTAGAIYPNSLYLLPLPLTDCSDTERLFWFKQSLSCSWSAFLSLDKSTWPAILPLIWLVVVQTFQNMPMHLPWAF